MGARAPMVLAEAIGSVPAESGGTARRTVRMHRPMDLVAQTVGVAAALRLRGAGGDEHDE